MILQKEKHRKSHIYSTKRDTNMEVPVKTKMNIFTDLITPLLKIHSRETISNNQVIEQEIK